jgi:choice-of-anchor B domain-containing protein
MTQKYLFFLLFCCLSFLASGQSARNILRVSRWDDPTLPIGGFDSRQKYSACWGMYVNGREYAIIGALAYTVIIDITQPAMPKEVARFAGVNCIWREFKTYKNRIYVANDCGGGLQIIDMSKAPDSIKLTYNSTALVQSMHTITLDTVSGRIYGNSVPVILDVSADPDKPVSLTVGTNPCLGAHDTYVRNDTIYSSSGNAGYFVCDFKNPAAPKLLAQATTGGYNHNSWLTADGRYAYYTEEIPDGRPIRIVDLSDLKNGSIDVVGQFFDQLITVPTGATRAIPHNLYIKGDLLYNSQYEDGLLVYDISDRLKPKLVAWFDTHPQNTKYNQYRGCWGNYPWLPSGLIVTSDMQNGMDILRVTYVVSAQTPAQTLDFEVSPNPVSDQLRITMPDPSAAQTYQLHDTHGRLMASGPALPSIDCSHLVAGVYFLRVQGKDGKTGVRKVVKN